MKSIMLKSSWGRRGESEEVFNLKGSSEKGKGGSCGREFKWGKSWV